VSWDLRLCPLRSSARIHGDVVAILASGLADELSRRGLDPVGLPAAQFAELIRADHAKWTAVALRARPQA
jgi:hypothetical protein